MKITRQIIKGIALSMCLLIFSLTVASAYNVNVQAASSTAITLTKLVDMSLTSTGIIANSTIIDVIAEKLENLNDSVTLSYQEYCELNGYDLGIASLKAYIDSGEPSESEKKLLEYILSNCESDEDVVDWFGQSNIVVGVMGGAAAVAGQSYTINDGFVEIVRELFDDYAEEEADYYYIDTLSPKNINPLWFKVKADYDNFCSVLQSANGYLYLDLSFGSSGTLTFDTTNSYSTNYYTVYAFEENFYLLDNGYDKTEYYYKFIAYDVNWENSVAVRKVVGYNSSHAYTTEEELLIMGNSTNITSINSHLFIPDNSKYVGLCSSDGRKLRVFNNMDALKLYSVGNQPYYLNQSNDYSTTNDNSVTFDGTYYEDNATSYSYDIVQNEIDNSTEINEETVNNIVNDSSTTIINNYYTSSDSGDGDGSGDGSVDDSGSSGGITDLISAVGGFLNLIITVLTEIITLLTTFISSAISLISSLGESFAGFSTLLGALFVFIPKELTDSIGAGIMLLIVLAFYKGLKR